MINSTPRFKRASMFECYRVLISHVSGCLQDRRVFHEVITLITREALLRDVHGGMKVCGVRRELSVERLGSCRSIYRELHMSRISCVEASPWRAERPRVRMWSEQKGQPWPVPHTTGGIQIDLRAAHHRSPITCVFDTFMTPYHLRDTTAC